MLIQTELSTEPEDQILNPDAEPIWVSDPDGELVFFCIKENGQITEWVWL